jgi:ATP phosphoribosyltransferase
VSHELVRPLRIGLPKGRLSSLSHRLARFLEGYNSSIQEIKIWELRIQDIPRLVADKELDVGITSDEWVAESGAMVRRLMMLNWWRARICLVAPQSFKSRPAMRIASEYPSLASIYARGRWGLSSTIRSVFGSAEAYVPDLADAAIVCVETGETLRRHDLVVQDVLLDSNCWLVASPALEHRQYDKVLRQLSPGLRSAGRPGPPSGKACELRSLPPHFRILAWPAMQESEGYDPLSVSVPAELRVFGVGTVVVSPRTYCRLPAALEQSYSTLEDELCSREAIKTIWLLYELISVLSIFDSEIQERRIYPGHIYLASDRAVESLLEVCNIPVSGTVSELLDTLQAFELIYRFPIARKFTDSFTVARQCRANGWGRLLYDILRKSELGGDIENWRSRIADHIQKHLSAYKKGVEAALASERHDGGYPWLAIVGQLPVPIVT